MSTTTPRIGLKSPEGTDPFLTQDFIDNWSTIDTAVGDLQDVLSGGIDADSLNGHPDTYFYSADNPPPATPSGGDVDYAGPMWRGYGGASPWIVRGANQTLNVTAIRAVTPAAGRLMFFITAMFSSPGSAAQYASITGKVDGTAVPGGYTRSGIPAVGGGSGTAWYSVPLLGHADVNAGNHTISFDWSVGNGTPSVTLYYWRCLAFFGTAGTTF